MHDALLNAEFFATLDALVLALPRRMNAPFAGLHPARALGSSTDFADLHPYMPGDDPRRIDWNLYARHEQLYLRRHYAERQLSNVIYVDASASMSEGENREKISAALKITAALAYLTMSGSDRAHIRVIHGHRAENLCAPIRTRDAFFAALAPLTQITFEGNADLAQAISNDSAPGYDDGISFLVSDFLTDTWKPGVDALLARRRAVALIQVLCPDELHPAYAGPLALLDAEAETASDPRNMRLRIDRAALRAYQQALEFFRKDMADFCASRGVPFVTLRSDEPIPEALIREGYAAGMFQ